MIITRVRRDLRRKKTLLVCLVSSRHILLLVRLKGICGKIQENNTFVTGLMTLKPPCIYVCTGHTVFSSFTIMLHYKTLQLHIPRNYMSLDVVRQKIRVKRSGWCWGIKPISRPVSKAFYNHNHNLFLNITLCFCCLTIP